MTRIAIYTAIFGEKDSLRDPINYIEEENIDYFCFSEKDEGLSNIYKYLIRKPILKDFSLNSRYYKILGDEFFNDYNYIIWHDGNIQIDHGQIRNLIFYSSNYFLTTFKHPHRKCFYEEASICIRRNKENPLNIFKQVLIYNRYKLPYLSGLFETGIMVKNNKYHEQEFFSKWWEHTFKYSNRDQLSLSFLFWFENKLIGQLPGSGSNNKFSIYWPHSKNYQIKFYKRIINNLFLNIMWIIKPQKK